MSDENKVLSLLASLDNLPQHDLEGRIAVLIECVRIQQEEIHELQKWSEDADEELEDKEKEE